MFHSMTRHGLYAATISLTCLAPAASQAATAKNVLLFIADGASWGTWDLASYYEHGKKGQQPYDAFSVKLGMTTLPAGDKTYAADPAWSTNPGTGTSPSGLGTPDKSYANYFDSYEYLRQGYTDSAAAATALASGEKTINGRINIGTEGQELNFISRDMKAAGKAVGVLSSVPFSHATPAGFGANNISRNNYLEIAEQMINEGTIDVLMGGGNPLYDENGQPRDEASFNRISETDWNALNGAAAPMTLIQDKADFEAIAAGTTTLAGRVIGLPKVGDTLQQGRTDAKAADTGTPSGLAYNSEVPTLETMTRAALNLLDDDEDGLFLMVEGGAVDWAAHANQTDRIIEEMMDFNHAVAAGINWVETNSSWDETLMIVLTDHGNSMPMAIDSDVDAFSPITNAGAGVVPDVRWHFDSHTVENTLMWAHGANAGMLRDFVIGNDPALNVRLGHNNGDYFENQSIAAFMAKAADLGTVAAVPVPGGIWLLGPALLGLIGWRRHARHVA